MAGREISPQKAAASVVARLRCFADPVRAAGARRYFKHTIETFGATAPQVRGVVADLYASVRGRWSFDDALALCDILVREAELESKAVGTLILSRFKKEFPRSLFGKIKGWLASDLLANWASVDTLCTDAMGAFLEKYPEYVDRIKRWAGHSNRWVKRASAVSFIKLARKPAFLPAVYEIAASLFPVDDDLVQKATGWLLREAGKADSRRLERFLFEHGPAIPRTTVRYAIERFDEKTRKRLLVETR